MSITWGYQWLSKPRGKGAASPFLQLYRPRYWEGDTVARYKIAVGNSKSLGFVAWRVPPSPPTSPSLHVFIEMGRLFLDQTTCGKNRSGYLQKSSLNHHRPSSPSKPPKLPSLQRKQANNLRKTPQDEETPSRPRCHSCFHHFWPLPGFGLEIALEWSWEPLQTIFEGFSLFFLWRRCSRNRRTPHNLRTSLWSSSSA